MSKYSKFTDRAYRETMKRIADLDNVQKLNKASAGLAGTLALMGINDVRAIRRGNKQLREALPAAIAEANMLATPLLAQRLLGVGGKLDDITPQLQNHAAKKALIGASGGAVGGGALGYLTKESSAGGEQAYRKGLHKALGHTIAKPLSLIALGVGGSLGIPALYKGISKIKANSNAKKILKRGNNVKDIFTGKRSIAANHLAANHPRSAKYRDLAVREKAKKNVLQLGAPAAAGGAITYGIVNE